MSTRNDDPADTDVSAGSGASEADSGPTSSPASRPVRRSRWYAVVLVGIFAAVLTRALVVETYFSPDRAMEPAIGAGDRLIVAKWMDQPARGDVVVADVTTAFAGPEPSTPTSDGMLGRVLGRVASILGVDLTERSILARVVAVGGDEVACSPHGQIEVNDAAVSDAIGCAGLDLTVPKGSVWVLGDHPTHALDSFAQVAEPGQGAIPVEDIIGTVVLRAWPLGSFTIPAPVRSPG